MCEQDLHAQIARLKDEVEYWKGKAQEEFQGEVPMGEVTVRPDGDGFVQVITNGRTVYKRVEDLTPYEKFLYHKALDIGKGLSNGGRYITAEQVRISVRS